MDSENIRAWRIGFYSSMGIRKHGRSVFFARFFLMLRVLVLHVVAV